MPAARVPEVIFGYTCANDVTARDLQARDGQWTRAKGFDTFCPIGPWVVTKDEIGELDRMTFHLDVNGQRRQTGMTGDMIYSIRRLVALASYQTTLYPGDIIASGTPQGVGEVKPGDKLRLEVDRVGVLEIAVAPDYAEPPANMGAWFDPFLVSRGAPV